jgi:GT2 family glycosyltransferase
MSVRLSIQIVTWNSGEDLKACLESLATQTCSDFEVIVLDNASADGSADRAEKMIPSKLDGRVLRESTNRGFCGGHNHALKASSGEWVLFLNPDAILPPDFVQQAILIVDRADPDVGSICPRILLHDGRLDSAGLTVDRFRRVYDRGHGEAAAGRYEIEEDVEGCTGAVVLHRRAMLEDIAIRGEVLDEGLFAYYDDIDLSWRARLYGWRSRYVPNLRAIHRRSGRNALRKRATDAPRTAQQMLMVRNRFLVMTKCERAIDLVKGLPWLLPFEAARLLFLVVRAPGALRGYLGAASMLPTALRNRRVIQATAAQRQSRGSADS